MKTIRVFEAFAGIGAQHEGWERLQKNYPEYVNFEFVGISEIDDHAVISYKAAHGEITNYGDISKINWDEVPDFDMFTWSFPVKTSAMPGNRKVFQKKAAHALLLHGSA